MPQDMFSQFQQPQSGGFFKKSPPPMDPMVGELGNQVRDISRRLRIIEERYSNLRKNIQVNEQNMLSDGKRVSTEMKALNSDIGEMKRSIIEMKEDMRMMVTEVREAVKKEELKVLEKYVSFWEPVNFVTHAEVERIIDLRIQKMKAKDP